jgi:cation transport ATPase
VRALAVFVVATPCPLILAAPIAFMGGVSRAARRGIIVKGATALEQLGRARTVVLDKTGTLTSGTPAVEEICSAEGVDPDTVLRLAASVDQLSPHVLAEALVDAAARRGLSLDTPTAVEERPGEGSPAWSTDGRSRSGRPHGCASAASTPTRRPRSKRPLRGAPASPGSSSGSTADWPDSSSWATICVRMPPVSCAVYENSEWRPSRS